LLPPPFFPPNIIFPPPRRAGPFPYDRNFTEFSNEPLVNVLVLASSIVSSSTGALSATMSVPQFCQPALPLKGSPFRGSYPWHLAISGPRGVPFSCNQMVSPEKYGAKPPKKPLSSPWSFFLFFSSGIRPPIVSPYDVAVFPNRRYGFPFSRTQFSSTQQR